MPIGPVPKSFHDLLESTAFAFVSTLGKTGETQVNPVWFLWTGTHIQIGLMPGTQKYVNLVRDERIAIAIAHPGNPYRYLEVRGRVRPLEPDVGDVVFNAISTKYTGARSALRPRERPASSAPSRLIGTRSRTRTASRPRRDGNSPTVV